MIDLDAARAIAARDAPQGLQVDDTRVQEIRTGWFFPYRHPSPDSRFVGSKRLSVNLVVGSKGLVVNKQTGATFVLGSAFTLERDLVLYDKGYQFEFYDLVVTRILDKRKTVDTLLALRISTVAPSYGEGTVWRVPRPLTPHELRAALKTLPHVFGRVQLYFVAEALEWAREKGFFQFELLGCR